MGSLANGRMTRVAAIAATAVVLFLNTILLLQTFGAPLLFLEG
jgi:manganese transport protein